MTKQRKRFNQRFPFYRITESFIFVSVLLIMAFDQRDMQYNRKTKKGKTVVLSSRPRVLDITPQRGMVCDCTCQMRLMGLLYQFMCFPSIAHSYL